MDKEQILLEIKKIMENHKGEENCVSAGKIAEMLGLKQEDTHIQPRKYIYETMKKYRIPIAGGSRGYYIINDKKELERYTNNLDNRITEIEKRKQEVRTIFEKFYNK